MVISIVGLLMSVIYSNINNVREKAKMTAGIQFEANVLHTIGDALVSEWKFDQHNVPSTGRTPDTSGYENTGALYGVVYKDKEGYDGKGTYLFNGDSYIGIKGFFPIINFNGLNSFTESVWINTTKDSEIQTIIGWHSGIAWAMGTIQLKNGILEFLLKTNAFNTVSSDNKIPINKWTHIVVVFDSPNVLFYINGVLVSKKIIAEGAVNSNPLFFPRFGKKHSEPWNGFSGKIDTVRFYTTSLTAMDIRNIYAKEVNHYQDLATI
ncbi:MAG: LamG domain-containing protein [Patescibacteria group bacterium]